MKWTTHTRPKTPMDLAHTWQETRLDTSIPEVFVEFIVSKERRCWVAEIFASGSDSHKLGDYRTERLAKAACRRKAGRIVDALKRGIRA